MKKYLALLNEVRIQSGKRAVIRKIFAFLLRQPVILAFEKFNITRRFAIKGIRRRLIDRQFRRAALYYREEGYWELNPMPSNEFLEEYYSTIYWDLRDKTPQINFRDLEHYFFLKSHLDFKQINRVLNFGAGHGGLSFFCHLEGIDITNIEPSGIVNPPRSTKWETHPFLSEAKGKFELIYASHSMEHLTDLDSFQTKIDELLVEGGYLFIEVPNCEIPSLRGGVNGFIDPPHTYYFTKQYFESLSYEITELGIWKTDEFPSLRMGNLDGQVIRYLGRKINCHD